MASEAHRGNFNLVRRVERSEARWSSVPAGADEAQRFDVEVLQICRDLDPGREHPDRAKLYAQAAETVKRRWGIERYSAMRDAASRSWARGARQRANSGADGPAVSERAKRRRIVADTD